MSFIPPEGVEFREGRPMPTTSGGVPYITFINQARVAEGEVAPKGAGSMDDAWASFNATVNEYLVRNRAKVVEWRIPPSDYSWADKGQQFFRVRARLAIIEQYENVEAA